MAAHIPVCAEEEQCSVIWVLWSEGVSGAVAYQRLSAHYGNSVLPQQCVYEWIEKLKKWLHVRKEPDTCPQPQMRTT
jgi:hypothetical protein